MENADEAVYGLLFLVYGLLFGSGTCFATTNKKL
jgi:hypothetical protein